MTERPVDVDELHEYLNIKTPLAGAKLLELELMLDAAIEEVEKACGPLLARERTERVAVRAGRGLLTGWPALQVLTAAVPDTSWALLGALAPGSTVEPVPALTDAGEVLFGAAVGRDAWVDVTYTVGRDPVPASLRLAVLVIGKHLYGTQRGSGPSAGTGDEQRQLVGFAVPRRAAELMAGHRAPRVGAA